jgi:hypothetical protein
VAVGLCRVERTEVHFFSEETKVSIPQTVLDAMQATAVAGAAQSQAVGAKANADAELDDARKTADDSATAVTAKAADLVTAKSTLAAAVEQAWPTLPS